MLSIPFYQNINFKDMVNSFNLCILGRHEVTTVYEPTPNKAKQSKFYLENKILSKKWVFGQRLRECLWSQIKKANLMVLSVVIPACYVLLQELWRFGRIQLQCCQGQQTKLYFCPIASSAHSRRIMYEHVCEHVK